MKDPINRIEWRDAASLEANNWNPNVVFTPELRLLERSILLTGWTQPILITADGLIIDGFHRVRLALDSRAILERYGGKLPLRHKGRDRHPLSGGHLQNEKYRQIIRKLGIRRKRMASLRPASFEEIAPFRTAAARDHVSVSVTRDTRWFLYEESGVTLGFCAQWIIMWQR